MIFKIKEIENKYVNNEEKYVKFNMEKDKVIEKLNKYLNDQKDINNNLSK